jgi:hypothetical protein
MFNLYEDTAHEAGIIIHGEEAVIVTNWSSYGDNRVPMLLAPLGLMEWLIEDEDAKTVKLRDVEDIRDELPGKVWINEDGDADTDMDIVYDANGDLSALFGIRTGDTDPDFYKDFPHPFSGSVYEIAGTDIKVITIKNWI